MLLNNQYFPMQFDKCAPLFVRWIIQLIFDYTGAKGIIRLFSIPSQYRNLTWIFDSSAILSHRIGMAQNFTFLNFLDSNGSCSMKFRNSTFSSIWPSIDAIYQKCLALHILHWENYKPHKTNCLCIIYGRFFQKLFIFSSSSSSFPFWMVDHEDPWVE